MEKLLNNSEKATALAPLEPLQKLLLDTDDLARVLSLSRSTVWQDLCKREDFPKPVKLFSRQRRWRTSDVRSWVENLKV